ncbi:putative TRAP transporter solute receptor, TAXI family [Frankia sp. AgKG'84/4]
MRRLLGEGGMGTVYFALTRSGRPVAVKVIRAEYVAAPGFRERFLEEIENVRQIQQFCTAAVVDLDTGPTPYLVTEYVDGPDLRRQVAEGETLAGNDVKRFAIGVATALWAIHSARVVHRDLKPGNVLLAQHGPRVIDFGVASAIGATVGSRDAGPAVPQWLTPAFMAPEQAMRARYGAGIDISFPADIFAWAGVVLFAATGRAPFGEGDFLHLFDEVVYGEATLDGLPAELLGIVRQALEKNPARRPSARQLLASLLGDTANDTAEAGEAEADRGWETTVMVGHESPPPPATVPPPPPPSSNRGRRRPTLMLAAALVTVVLLLLLLPGSPLSPWPRSKQLGACPSVSVYTGQKGTPYYAYAQTLGRDLHQRYPGTKVVVDATDGTADNLGRLQDADGSTCALAVAQLNTAVDAYNGVFQFEGKALPALRTVGPIWLDVLHLMVRADSPVQAASELCGKRVSTGLGASGTLQVGEVLFRNVLHCPGDPISRGLSPALAELGTGQLDAVLWAGGAPTPQITQALDNGLKIRMLPLDKYLEPMATNWDGSYGFRLGRTFVSGGVYENAIIADYPGMAAVQSIGVPNGLVVNASADSRLVAFTARDLVEHRAGYETALWGTNRGGRHFEAPAQAIPASSLYCLVPLADAAKAYYGAIGINARCAGPR